MRDEIDAPANRSGQVRRVQRCELRLGDAAWPYAVANAGAIAGFWEQRRAQSPKLFNGTVCCIDRMVIENDVLDGRLLKTDFRSFLHWREADYPQAGLYDSFGAAILRSAEGYIVLGVQTSGNINAGLAYPPSGFIDHRDVTGDGSIDIAASCAREVAEETGLDVNSMQHVPGFLITQIGPIVAIASEWRSPLAAGDLRARIRAYLDADPDPELDDVVIVRSAAEIARHAMPPYARLMVSSLLEDGSSCRPR